MTYFSTLVHNEHTGWVHNEHTYNTNKININKNTILVLTYVVFIKFLEKIELKYLKKKNY